MLRPLLLPPVPLRTLPIGLSHRDKKLPGPHTSVKPEKPKKFGTPLFEDCLRLLGGLDHILRFVAFEACKLYNSRDLIPPLSPMGRSRSGRKRFTGNPYEVRYIMGQKCRFDRRPITSGLPRSSDMLGVSRYVSRVPRHISRLSRRKSSRERISPRGSSK